MSSGLWLVPQKVMNIFRQLDTYYNPSDNMFQLPVCMKKTNSVPQFQSAFSHVLKPVTEAALAPSG